MATTIKGITLKFINRPNTDGTLSTFEAKDCLVYPNGSPTTARPQISIHLSKKMKERVIGAWVKYDNETYHIIGMTAPVIKDNTDSRWDRYCVAERLY